MTKPVGLWIADADSINFDNYVAPLPKEIAAKTWQDRLVYRFGKLAFSKEADVQFRTSLKMGIFEKCRLKIWKWKPRSATA